MIKRRQLVIKSREAGATLQAFVERVCGLSKRKAKALLDTRTVFVNGQRVWMSKHELRTGDTVDLPEQAAALTAGSAPMVIPVLWREGSVVVVDKPPGMMSTGPRGAESLVREQMRVPGVRAAHRLDRDTSGCLVLVTTDAAFEAMVAQFRAHRVKKVYRAIVVGRLATPCEDIRVPIDGQTAVTHVQTLCGNRRASHLRVAIDTGRTHQIRKHLRHVYHPVLGDREYSLDKRVPEEVRRVPRQMLHAQSIEFEHPDTGERKRVEAPLPRDFRDTLRTFGLT